MDIASFVVNYADFLGALVSGGVIWAVADKVTIAVKNWRKSKAEGDVGDAAIKLADSARQGTEEQRTFSNRLLQVIESMPKEFSKALDKQMEWFQATLAQQDNRCDARTKSTLEFIEERYQRQTHDLQMKVQELAYTITNAKVTFPQVHNAPIVPPPNPFHDTPSTGPFNLSNKTP